MERPEQKIGRSLEETKMANRGYSGVRVVVGLDFGTTFSGFAYAHKSEPDQIHTFYEWPMQSQGGGKPYCKTQTSLYYERGSKSTSYQLKEWGWPAQVMHLAELQKQGDEKQGLFVRRFKLHLAGSQDAEVGVKQPARRKQSLLKRISLKRLLGMSGKAGGRSLPPAATSSKGKAEASPSDFVLEDMVEGMSVDDAITDFLTKLSQFALQHLQTTYGKHITQREVQWCLTVPAIWDDGAKQHMRLCAQRAGMVTGPECPAALQAEASPHPLLVVLESEAASIYCAKRCNQVSFKEGDEFLVADIGGGTVDLVLHSKHSRGLRELRESRGGLCGGTYVDAHFLAWLAEKVPCLNEYVRHTPTALTLLLRRWEELKCTFDNSPGWGTVALELPRRLSAAWERYDAEHTVPGKVERINYDEVELTREEMRAIFDPVVEMVLDLIREQVTPGMKALMLVGGFSASPYLSQRVRKEFQGKVGEIMNPPDPGSAICQGAVALGMNPQLIYSRISRRSYGINQWVPFKSLHPADSLQVVHGQSYCTTAFMVYVKRGEEVAVDQCVTRANFPVRPDQKSLSIQIYSCELPDPPAHITHPQVRKEGAFTIDISHDPEAKNLDREVLVSMYFGKSCIRLKAQRANFGNQEEVVEMFETLDFDHQTAI